jgi:hypothetical protein
MTSRQKAKGNSFEREVAKFLTEAYSEPFHRIVNSGAYVGGTNQSRKSQLDQHQVKSFRGDINAPDSWPYFNCEAKSYADIAFHQFYTGCSQLDGWLEQLMQVAEPSDVNILFMKITRRGRYIAVQSHLNWLRDCNYTMYNSSTTGSWLIYNFENFFESNISKLKQFSILGTQLKPLESKLTLNSTPNIVTLSII